MQYNKVTFTLSALEPWRDMLIYTLGDEGPYDSFEETPEGMNAFVPAHLFDSVFLQQAVDELRGMDASLIVEYQVENMADINYNEIWEREHQPVLVGDFCWVRAPYHPRRDEVPYEIVIDPKMSFGSAHHPTTYLMLTYLYQCDIEGKRLLDMGCGTAILAIFAALRGAADVVAVDVDEWAFHNAVENVKSNGVKVAVRLGDAAVLAEEKPFDVILANINRNILLNDMAAYRRVLNPGGTLLLSGFFSEDIPVLVAAAESFGMTLVSQRIRDNWTALELRG